MKRSTIAVIAQILTVSFLLIMSTVCQAQTPAAPATCTAAIGAPANGTAHHIAITWAGVSGATEYILQYSYDGSTWNVLDSANVTTYDHNASNTGNIPVYYRVKAYQAGNESGFTQCSPYPIYTACDNPGLPVLGSAGPYSLSVTIPAESPTPNSAATTYAIYCTTSSQYVQANGTLGAGAVYQTRATWGTVSVTGLTASTNYCFYSIARNGNGDTRIASGSSITAVQTFDASGSLNSSNSGPTTVYWTPPNPTSTHPLIWQSTGGCSGGSGAGNIGYSGSFTNYFGSFLRTPAVNCTGNSSVVLSFDLTNSYIASHLVSSPSSSDAVRLYMYVNGTTQYVNASSIKIAGNEVSSTDGNGTWLKFNVARSCVEVDATFNLSGVGDISGVLFYIEADNPYNDSYSYGVAIDNVNLNAGSASSCLSTTTCTAATISANPINQTVCSNGNTSFTVGTTGAVSLYQWQFSTDNGSTWNNVSNTGFYTNATTATLHITGVTSGLSGYQYRCQVTGACSGTPTSAAATLTVSSLPGNAGAITGTATVCQAQNGVVFSVAAVAGATGYSWSLPAGGVIVSGSGSNSISVNFSSGAAGGNVIVTPTNSCGNGAASASFAVTVNQLPSAVGAITGASNVCSNVSQTYSVSVVSGASSYTWALPGGWSGTSTTNNITVLPSATSGNLLVTANNSCGSTSAQSIAVTAGTAPSTPGVISGSSVVCSGVQGNYSVTAVSGATFYTWSLPGGWSGSSTTNSISVTPNSAGNISVTAGNSCGSSGAQILAVSLGAIPTAPLAISGPTSACNGDLLTYFIAPVAGATSYTWVLPNGWTGNSIIDTLHATAGSAGGTLSVKANNGCGSSANTSIVINTGSVPATPGVISGPDTICAGSSPNYSVAVVNGATSYTWTFPAGWSGASIANSVSPTAGTGSGNILVKANNACGSSANSSLAVIAQRTPSTPGTINGLTTVCSGSNASFGVIAYGGVTSYTWTLPNGWSGANLTNSINALVGTNSGTVSVVANNICGTSSASQLNVTVIPGPGIPGTISGSDSVCSGSNTSYGVAIVNGADTYNWTLPNGWSGSSTTNSISVTAGSVGGNIFVTSGNSCGNSAAQSLSVAVLSIPALPGSIHGPDSVCAGSAAPFSIATVSGATSYNWILPNGWNGNSNTAVISATAGTNPGNILVTASNLCGTSLAQNKNVNVNALPDVTFNYSNTPICSNAGPEVLNTGSPTGGTYSGTGVTGAEFSPAVGAGNYVVTYSITSGQGCVNSDTALLTVKTCTGIAEQNDASELLVYPNPFTDQLSLKWNANLALKYVVLYDVEGKEIERLEIPESNQAFEFGTNFRYQGIYLINLISSGGNSVAWKKVVKIY